MAKGTSGYLKSKKKTIAELDKATKTVGEDTRNPVDKLADDMDKENDYLKGVTDYVRNIFGD